MSLLAAATAAGPDHGVRNAIAAGCFTALGAMLSIIGSAFGSWLADRRGQRARELEHRKARALELAEATLRAANALRTFSVMVISGARGVTIMAPEEAKLVPGQVTEASNAIRSVRLEAIVQGWPTIKAVADEVLPVVSEATRRLMLWQVQTHLIDAERNEMQERVDRLDTLAEKAVAAQANR